MKSILTEIYRYNKIPDDFELEWDTDVFRIAPSLSFVVTRKEDDSFVQYKCWLVNHHQEEFLASQQAYVFSPWQATRIAAADMSLFMATTHALSKQGKWGHHEGRWIAMTPFRGVAIDNETAEECIMAIFGVLFLREGNTVLFVPESGLDSEAFHDGHERTPSEADCASFWTSVGLTAKKWGACGWIGQIDPDVP